MKIRSQWSHLIGRGNAGCGDTGGFIDGSKREHIDHPGSTWPYLDFDVLQIMPILQGPLREVQCPCSTRLGVSESSIPGAIQATTAIIERIEPVHTCGHVSHPDLTNGLSRQFSRRRFQSFPTGNRHAPTHNRMLARIGGEGQKCRTRRVTGTVLFERHII